MGTPRRKGPTVSIYRRCGCRDEAGRQYANLPDGATAAQKAKACPNMLRDPKHGTWGYYVAAGLDPKTGKRQQLRKAGFPTQQAARTARNQVAVRVDAGDYVTPTKETFAQYLEKWLPRRVNSGEGLKPTTVSNYARYISRDIAPSPLGQMRLSDIRRFHINAFSDQLIAEGRGPTTVRRIAAVIQGALRAAEQEDLIESNPSTGIRLPKVKREEFQPWEPAQVGHYLDVASTHRLGALFELAVLTGMRRGELIGLRWSDVDMSRRAINVRNNRVQAGNVISEHEPKTKAGRRVVDLSDPAAGALIAWKVAQDNERRLWGEAWQETGYVFTYEDGTPLKPQYVTRLFDKIRVKAGLPKLTFHGQRHEFASLMIASGADIAMVAKMLGHSSMTITSDLYTHLIGSRARQASENAAALLPPRGAGAHTSHTQGKEAQMEEAPEAATSA